MSGFCSLLPGVSYQQSGTIIYYASIVPWSCVMGTKKNGYHGESIHKKWSFRSRCFAHRTVSHWLGRSPADIPIREEQVISNLFTRSRMPEGEPTSAQQIPQWVRACCPRQFAIRYVRSWQVGSSWRRRQRNHVALDSHGGKMTSTALVQNNQLSNRTST